MLKVHASNLGDVAIVCLQGRIVNGETEILRNVVDALPEVRTVILDLARVTTVDARGLGVMLELRERMQAKGIRFQLMNITRMVRRVLEVSRLDSVFQITSGVEFVPAVSRSPRAPVTAWAPCA
jgi:anti-anti-sigma factor